MAFQRAKVELKPELQTMVQSLKDRFSVAYDEVEPDRIVYLQSDAKSKRAVKLAALKLPHPSVSQFRFALTIYSGVWNDLDEAHRVMHIHREMLRIANFEEGKLSGYPLTDFPEIIAKYGVDWEVKEDLPNILEDNEEQDEADTEESDELELDV